MPRLTAQELAELAHQLRPSTCIASYDLGLLEPGDDGSSRPSTSTSSGSWPRSTRRESRWRTSHAACGGAARVSTRAQLPEPDPTHDHLRELGERIGCEADSLRRLSAELGLPPNADDRLRAEDAEILSLMITRLDLCDEDELSRLARLYGGTMQRLVTSGIQFFDRVVRQRITSSTSRATRRTGASTRRRASSPRSSASSCRGSSDGIASTSSSTTSSRDRGVRWRSAG